MVQTIAVVVPKPSRRRISYNINKFFNYLNAKFKLKYQAVQESLYLSQTQPSQIDWNKDYVICKYETTIHLY